MPEKDECLQFKALSGLTKADIVIYYDVESLLKENHDQKTPGNATQIVNNHLRHGISTLNK